MLTVRLGSMDAVVMRVFASHHCGQGSIPGPDVTWGVLRVCSFRINKHSKFHFYVETVDKKSHLVYCPPLNSCSHSQSQNSHYAAGD